MKTDMWKRKTSRADSRPTRERMCGIWRSRLDRHTILRIYGKDGEYYFEEHRGNPVNGHIKIVRWRLVEDEGGNLVLDGIEEPVAYDTRHDRIITLHYGTYKRLKGAL